MVIDCCTREADFNPFYGFVLKALVDHGKDHAYTVRYCVWDLVKEVRAALPSLPPPPPSSPVRPGRPGGSLLLKLHEHPLAVLASGSPTGRRLR